VEKKTKRPVVLKILRKKDLRESRFQEQAREGTANLADSLNSA